MKKGPLKYKIKNCEGTYGSWITISNTLIFKIIFIGDSETDHYAASKSGTHFI